MLNKIKYLFLAGLLAIGACVIFAGHSDQYIRDRVVMLTGESGGQCSGEQVRAPSGEDYILTAAHCRALESNGYIHAKTEAGLVFNVGIVEESPTADLLLLEGIPHLRGLDMAASDHKYQWIRTFTHGRGMDTYETSGPIVQNKVEQVMIGAIWTEEDFLKCMSMPKYKVAQVPFIFDITMPVCVLEEEFTVSTAMVVPGSSGGVVVDSLGDVVGVVSAGGEGFGLFVTIEDIRTFVNDF